MASYTANIITGGDKYAMHGSRVIQLMHVIRDINVTTYYRNL
jgi:hypothetical protein